MPVELVALDQPHEGLISARREGEPSFTPVQGVGDAILVSLSRGVDLVVPREPLDEIRTEATTELPPYIKVR